MNSHRCPARGCPTNVPNDQLACKRHWTKLPWRMRTNITEAWRSHDGAAHSEAITSAFEFYATHDVDSAPEHHGGHTSTTLDSSSSGPSYSTWDGGSTSGGTD